MSDQPLPASTNNQYDFTGTHALADVIGVHPDVVYDESRILTAVSEGIQRAGATVCGVQIHRFSPRGFTALFLLSESHVSVHTYPEHGAMFIDAFTCGTRCDPTLIVNTLLDELGTHEHVFTAFRRGAPGHSEIVAHDSASALAERQGQRARRFPVTSGQPGAA